MNELKEKEAQELSKEEINVYAAGCGEIQNHCKNDCFGGGKHRSVTLARELYSRLSGNTKYGFRLEHRDAQKDRLVRKQEG